MKWHSISFGDEMVRAILDDRKTQTRQIVKGNEQLRWNPVVVAGYGGWENTHGRPRPCPYGKPGDRLWVKETWTYGDSDGETFVEIIFRADGGKVRYSVSEEIAAKHLKKLKWLEVHGNGENWRSPRFMPRWASRITLEVTWVGVEQLQDIDHEDCVSEGVHPHLIPGCDVDNDGITAHGEWHRRNEFKTLWKSINGKGSWEANPWVWAIEFKVLGKAR